MVTTFLLSVLLMLGSLSGVAESDLLVPRFVRSLNSRHAKRGEIHDQVKPENHRSLDEESFRVNTTPAVSKSSSPVITRLFPPSAAPSHKHVNMPLRFGRQIDSGEGQSSNPNLPQRFGRAWEMIRASSKCPLLRVAHRHSLANARLFNTDLEYAAVVERDICRVESRPKTWLWWLHYGDKG
ncbi:pro-FMRFamide-related neuropeptide VF [Synchiropus splendidus]|uniref:pro-FMRFamide-related neuropeptide VF n=1 Tax=Synchiropus splendidus TaxID=270530 RepID=UPI00237E32AC|nr:pro-FMRFamide-related neuropeptide VF [Synchiropus splendidus]